MDLMTEEDLAQLLGKSTGTVRRWRYGAENEGPAYIKVGGTVRYRQEDLQDWLTASRVETSQSTVPTDASSPSAGANGRVTRRRVRS